MRALALLCVAASLPSSLGACNSREEVSRPELPPLDSVPAGTHDIERVQYNDTNDVYRVFLAGKPKGTQPLRLLDVRLALLRDADIAAGHKPRVLDDGKGPLLMLGPRFKITILHGVVEQRVDQDGRHNVVTSSDRKAWSPFVIPKLVNGKNLWERPAFHYPPPWTSGPLLGSGASGPTRAAAAAAFRQTQGELPQAVRLHNEGYRNELKDEPKDIEVAAGPDAGPADKANRRLAAPGGVPLKLEVARNPAELAKQRGERPNRPLGKNQRQRKPRP